MSISSGLANRVNRATESLLNLVFPPRCAGCGKIGYRLCDECSAGVRLLAPPFCSLCGRPTGGNPTCTDCLQAPLKIGGIRSVGYFEGVLRDAIHDLKYRNRRQLAQPLAGMMFTRWQQEFREIPAEVVTPVPLHRARLRERGYNQSDLLASAFSSLAGLPVARDLLARTRHTKPQVELDGTERRLNMAGAFEANGDPSGKRVLLIDDVCTTGATLEACSEALVKAGARSVWAFTLARAL